MLTRLVVAVGLETDENDWRCLTCDVAREDSTFDVKPPEIDLRAPPDRRTKRTSRKRELEVAEMVGGRRQPGSGNQPFAKGDVRKKGEFRLELKECFGVEFKAHRIQLLDKIRSECTLGEHPAVVITFREKVTHEALESWVMLPFEVWEKKFNAADPNR